MESDLGPEKALIFRITHRDNLPWILDNGLHCRSSPVRDPNFVAIGNQDLIERRRAHAVTCPPGGTLGDYVPFYFTPYSPMFFNIKTGFRGIRQFPNDEIVILVSSLRELHAAKARFLFTDRHAVLAAARIFDDIKHLDQIDWGILRRRDFARDPEDPRKVERYEAEALIYRQLPVQALSGVVCHDEYTRDNLTRHADRRGLEVPIEIKPGWYFR